VTGVALLGAGETGLQVTSATIDEVLKPILISKMPAGHLNYLF